MMIMMVMIMMTMIAMTAQPMKLHSNTNNLGDDDWHDDVDANDVNDHFDNTTHKTALQSS